MSKKMSSKLCFSLWMDFKFELNNNFRFFVNFTIFNKLLSFLEICNNSNCKSYIFSDTNIDLLKQNNDVFSEYTMHILFSGLFPLNFAASRNVNIQKILNLDNIITNDNKKNTIVFKNIQSILRPLFWRIFFHRSI